MSNATPKNLTDIGPSHSRDAGNSSKLLAVVDTTTTITVPTTTEGDGGLGAGPIIGIVIGCLLFIALVALAAWFAVRKLRERRRNHGEYRPQLEESLHAKNLPYIQPPNIQGLM